MPIHELGHRESLQGSQLAVRTQRLVVCSATALRWSMSLGHELACAVVPPPTKEACRGTQCPGWEKGWQWQKPQRSPLAAPFRLITLDYV